MLASHVGRETQIEALGQTWTVGRWDLRVWDEFLAWARTQLPDPLEIAERSCLRLLAQERAAKARLELATDDAEKAAIRGEIADLNAMQAEVSKQGVNRAAGYLAVSSPEVQSLVNSPRGGTKLLHLLLKKHHPDLTEDDVFVLMQNLDPEAIAQAVADASGRVPPGKASGN